MSIFDRAKKQKTKRTSTKAAAETTKARAAVDDAPSVNGAEPASATTVAGGAPWANPKCKACKGRGFTSKNKACPICDNTAKRGGRPTSMLYVVEEMDEGLMMAVARAESVEELEAAGMPLEWEEAQEAAPALAAQEAPAPTPEPQAPEAAAETPPAKARRKRRTKAEMAAAKEAATAAEEAALAEATDQREAAQAAAKPESKRKAGRPSVGRPPVGLTIMVGATYMRGLAGGREVVSSSEVLARFGDELAQDMGADSYWALDTWKRRERLAEKADYIVGTLAKQVVVHPGELGNDDIGALLRALMSVDEGIEAVIMRVG